MDTPNDFPETAPLDEHHESGEQEPRPQARMQFIEPSVSAPADVLESITFFQGATIEASTV